MKAVVLSALAAIFACSAPAFTQAQSLTAEQAKETFDRRSFTQEGVQNALRAGQAFEDLANHTLDFQKKAAYFASQSQALYFVGLASNDPDQKIEFYFKGYEAADSAMGLLGLWDLEISDSELQKISSKLSDESRELLARSLYFRGVNLGQWGNARGVLASLSRWPELRRTMELLVRLGYEYLADYGAYRTLGFAYARIPRVMGGSLEKAITFSSKAVTGSLIPGQKVVSRNGFNNLYYAEVLVAVGRTSEAVAILNAFIDTKTQLMNPDLKAENEFAKLRAMDLLVQLGAKK